MTVRESDAFGRRIAASFVLFAAAACLRCDRAIPVDPGLAVPVETNVHARPAVAAFEFADVTRDSDVDFLYRDGQEAGHCAILQSLGGGAAMLDFDADGLLDLFFPGGGLFDEVPSTKGVANGLFRNLGDWRFRDVTSAAGASGGEFYSHGCVVGDYDNDAFPDVVVTGYGGLQVLRNQGDGTFSEVRRVAGMLDASWSSSGGWGDFNGDGNLDLYLAHYVDWSFANHPHCPGRERGQREICGPKIFAGLPDVLYLSDGQGGFRDGSSTAGLRTDGKGLGVLLGDVDDDLDLDIYVANDEVDNFLYINDGHGVFKEEGLRRGVAVSDHGTADGSMGVDMGDYNSDGRQDLFVANFEDEASALYRNMGDGYFTHASKATGITSLGGLYVGFGSVLRDFDNDGDEDLAIANGHVILHPTVAPFRQTPLLLVNHGGETGFSRVEFPTESFFQQPRRGRGLAAGDLDEDGDLDLVISHLDDPVAVLRNETPPCGSYVRVRLIGRASNRDAVGASVTLRGSHGDVTRQVVGGGSYCSHSDLRLHFGVPSSAVLHGLSIRWPSGHVQDLSPPPIDAQITVIEPYFDRDREQVQVD